MREQRGARKKRPSLNGPKRVSRHLEGVKQIDVRDYELLRRFVTDHGKIMPARLTGASAKQQRQIKHGVRRARQMGIMA